MLTVRKRKNETTEQLIDRFIELCKRYTLESENGASLKASNFICDGLAGGKEWTGERKRNYYIAPQEMKNRWHKDLN